VLWCNTNDEAERLAKLIPGGVNVYGSMKTSDKENELKKFANGETRVLITKPSIAGFGLNLQHVCNVVFVGLSFSFEQRYQAIRRCWRFGQLRSVNDYLVLSPAEEQAYRIVHKKESNHKEMQERMVRNISDYSDLAPKKKSIYIENEREDAQGENWKLILGDAVKEIKTIPSESVHLCLHSPPFSQLYIYSDSIADMGNCKDDDEFLEHYEYIIPEIHRVTVPGRLCVVHCKDLVNYKNNAGRSGLRDFPGKIIRSFEKHDWQYHSRVTIWKDPVIEMQRTKSQGLLHAQVKRDTSMSRQGLPDYLLVFRKWPDTGETSGPEPIVRERGFDYYIGENPPGEDVEAKMEDSELYSIHVWQRYASPVWFDIQQTNVLNCKLARTKEDEKHICPLQLPIIERVVHLWSLEGDTVFSPFAGIGSELYGAVKLNRKGLGIELKKSYFDYGVNTLEGLELKMRQKQLQLF
jgi:DNA modification methylase